MKRMEQEELEVRLLRGMERERQQEWMPGEKAALGTMKTAIDQRIDREEDRRKSEMKRQTKWTTRRVVAAVVLMCLVIGTGAMAAGKVVSTRSGSSRADVVEDYERAGEVLQQAGLSGRIPESLRDYQYAGAVPQKEEDMDEAGQVIRSYYGVGVEYQKDGTSLYLDLEPNFGVEDDSTHTAQITRTAGDVTLYYNERIDVLVPDGYELTEEEKDLESDTYYFSYAGTEQEREEHSVKSVLFNADGLTYVLLGFDSPLTAEDFLSMAQEVLETPVR